MNSVVLKVLNVQKVLKVLVLRVLMVLIVLAPIAARAGQQTPPLADGVISGRVVDAVSGRPVSAAIVTIAITAVVAGRGGPASVTLAHPPAIITGADGRFIFPDLTTPGTFTITATKGGFADGASGRRRPGGPSQSISLGTEKSSDIVVRMWKNGAIAGRVVDEAGDAVVGVRVMALERNATFGAPQFTPTSASGLTDDRGMYRFSNLRAGAYVVVATPPVISMKATVFEDVARTGRVGGDLGGAMMGASLNGMIVAGDAVLPLPRGSVIPPTSRGGRLQVYPPTLHPSATTPSQASVITIASGEERTGIDVQLMPAATSRISGTLLGPSGPAGEVRVQLVPARGEELPLDSLAPVSVSDAMGAFVFAAVVPGQYTLRATQVLGAHSGEQLHWVELPITVTGDNIDGVTAVLAPPLHVTARMQFDGNGEHPVQQTGRFTNAFSLEPIDRPPTPVPTAGTISDGAVTLSGYLPGRYRVRVANSPAGWMFKSAMLNGVDVSETPFDLTRDVTDVVLMFTDRWSGISGRAQGAEADGATVVVFTTDAQKWAAAGSNPRRLRSARANARGEFGISSLPPGDYYVTAIRDEDAGDWRDPAVLEALARGATQITIMEGEHKTLDVPVQEIRR